MGFRTDADIPGIPSGQAPRAGYLCLEPGSADLGYVWNFTDGDWVPLSDDPDIEDISEEMTLLDDYAGLNRRLWYHTATTLGGSPGRVITMLWGSTGTFLGQGEELYIRGNERVSQAQNEYVFPGVTRLQVDRAVAAFAVGTVDPSTVGDVTTLAFKINGTTYVTVTLDETEDGKRTGTTFAS